MKIDDKKANNEYIRGIYNAAQKAWAENDNWHIHTHDFINNYVINAVSRYSNSKSKILNAGSGGSTYSIPGIFYNCDIAEKLIENSVNPIIASVEDLPCDDEFFDYSICVGSVLNYCDATSAISELSRTLKSGGLLVLEFERSNSSEFIFTSQYGKQIFPMIYDYNGETHHLWMYNEQYISQLLNVYSFDVKNKRRFHSFSSLVFRATRRMEAGKYIKYDFLTQPFNYFLAHNVIYTCQKK